MNYESILRFITGESEDVFENIRPARNLSSFESLDIYRTDYWSRLQSVLSEHFPITHKILGDEQFSKYARLYITQNPSHHWDINSYGEAFPCFLQHIRGPSIDRFFPFLVEIAQLEWDSHLLFHAPPESQPVKALEIDEAFLGALKVSPLMRLSLSNYNLPEIYRAAQNETNLANVLMGRPSYFFLARRNFQVHLEELNENEFYLLNIWKQCGSLGLAAEFISDKLKDDHPILNEVTPLLQKLLELELLTN